LEMRTLHHSFAVDTERYPEHPLAMAEQDRLAALTEEMITRIDDPRLMFRVGLYREIVEGVITVLAKAFAEPGAAPTLDDSQPRRRLRVQRQARARRPVLRGDHHPVPAHRGRPFRRPHPPPPRRRRQRVRAAPRRQRHPPRRRRPLWRPRPRLAGALAHPRRG